MHNNSTIVPYISLCSGYEGIGLGLSKCIPNLRTIAYCEREAFVIANLVAKMEKGYLDEAPIFTDVTTFPWADFAPFMAGGILSFGWPCQPVSSAGKRKATEDERWLFDIIADGISILRPAMLFAENVEGLLSAKMPDGSSVFGHCIQRLESLHYKVEAGIFSASEVGAPHQRKRVFILAHNDSNGSRQSGLLREGTNGSVTISNGEAGRIELAHSKNKRCRGRSDRDGNDSRRISEQKTQLKSVLRGEVEGCCGDSRETMANSCNDTNTTEGLCQEGSLQTEHRQEVCARFVGGTNATTWPSRPGQPQYWWEPPRVVTTIKSPVGGDITRSTSRMGYAELCQSCDSRNDELRLLGNGVVPQTCTKAFIILFDKLMNEGKVEEEQGTLNL